MGYLLLLLAAAGSFFVMSVLFLLVGWWGELRSLPSISHRLLDIEIRQLPFLPVYMYALYVEVDVLLFPVLVMIKLRSHLAILHRRGGRVWISFWNPPQQFFSPQLQNSDDQPRGLFCHDERSAFWSSPREPIFHQTQTWFRSLSFWEYRWLYRHHHYIDICAGMARASFLASVRIGTSARMIDEMHFVGQVAAILSIVDLNDSSFTPCIIGHQKFQKRIIISYSFNCTKGQMRLLIPICYWLVTIQF